MTLHDDRFIYDDMPASAFERETSADKIAKLEVLRERFLLEARAFAEGVKLIDPNFIDRFEIATRTKSASHAEIIQGFCECVSDNVADLIDEGEVESLRRISESGRDND